MIKRIKHIEHLGPINSVRNIELERVTFFYGGNGQGKTKLSEVMRTIATEQHEHVKALRRLGQDEIPVVQLDCGEPEGAVSWTADGWLGDLPQIAVFNEGFVHANVMDGMEIAPRHRQGLFQLIVGEQIVRLQNDYDAAAKKVEKRKNKVSELRSKLMKSLLIEDENQLIEVCREPVPHDIERRLDDVERRLRLADECQRMTSVSALSSLPTPEFNLGSIESSLAVSPSTIAAQAFLKGLKTHFQSLGKGGEEWVRQGWERGRHDRITCPFCKQELPQGIMDAFGAYFSDEYNAQQTALEESLREVQNTHGENNRTQLTATMTANRKLLEHWSGLVPGLPSLNEYDVDQIVDRWGAVAEPLIEAVSLKVDDMLKMIPLPPQTMHEYESFLKLDLPMIEVINKKVKDANQKIRDSVAESDTIDTGQLKDQETRLRGIQIRDEDEIVDSMCADFLHAIDRHQHWTTRQKSLRAMLRKQLDIHAKRFADAVNRNLMALGAKSFAMAELDTTWQGRGNSSTTYAFDWDGEVLEESKARAAEDAPSVANTLSQGDKSVVAFAFFLADVEEREHIDELVVVIDDPVSSLDAHRIRRTADLVCELAPKVRQLIVMSHYKEFLFLTKAGLPREIAFKSWEIAEASGSSEIRTWDIGAAEAAQDADRSRVAVVRNFAKCGGGNLEDICVKIRAILEHHLKDVFPGLEFGKKPTLGSILRKINDEPDLKMTSSMREKITIIQRINKSMGPEVHDSPRPPIDEMDLRDLAKDALEVRGVNWA